MTCTTYFLPDHSGNADAASSKAGPACSSFRSTHASLKENFRDRVKKYSRDLKNTKLLSFEYIKTRIQLVSIQVCKRTRPIMRFSIDEIEQQLYMN